MRIRQRLGILRLAVLGLIPGDKSLVYRERQRQALRALCGDPMRSFEEALKVHKGKVHIDLGANLGLYTRSLSEHGTQVYAFEPDPWTAERLRSEVRELDNVIVVEAAAGTQDGRARMYRKIGFDSDPEAASDGSSLLAEKCNVDTTRFVEVRCVDFIRFLNEISGEIGILKVDIEGAEIELLNALLRWDGLTRIGQIFVETHETRIPSQRKDVDRLWRMTRRMTHPSIDLNWR